MSRLIVLAFIAAPLFAAIDFERQILPILEERCIDCHRATYKDGNGKLKKPKAGLRLDSPTWIMRGSEDGKVLDPGKPNQSSLYTLVILPSNDDDIMPPKGDPLTAPQQALLRTWIAEGASFGKWKGTDSDSPPPAPIQARTPQPATVLEASPFAKIASQLQTYPIGKLQSAADRGIMVEQVGDGPFLRFEVVYNGHALSGRHLLKYKQVFRNISELLMRRSRVTDGELKLLAYMPHLRRIDLSETSIDGSGFEHIDHLKFVQSLNLFNTRVDDEAIPYLGKLQSLQQLYIWKSKISPNGVAQLRKLLPNTEIIAESPYE
jgi:hypothetical protein